jgi:sugar phosphate isomerase/epimerase
MSRPLYSRRDILAGISLLPAPLWRVTGPLYEPKLIAHTHIWLLEARRRRTALSDLVEEAFSGTHRAGYRRIELVSEFFDPPMRDNSLRLLQKHKLEPAVVSFERSLQIGEAADNTRREVLSAARVARDFGASALALTPYAIDCDPKRAEEQIHFEAFFLTSLGQELRALGMELLLHHSLPDMRERAWRWKRVVSGIQPSLVSVCLDLDLALTAGLDPLALLNESMNQLGGLHLRSTLNGVPMQELGEGDIDMTRVAKMLRQAFYRGYLSVDLRPDMSTEPRQSIPMSLYRSRKFMQEVFGPRPGYLPVDMGPHVRIKGL